MLAREMLIKAFAYNAWANGRVLDQAQSVSEAQWTQKTDGGGRTLQEVLAHLFSVEQMWRLLSAHEAIKAGDMTPLEDLQTVEAMRRLSDEESEFMETLLRDWSDEAFAEELMLERWDGVIQPLIRWQILHHLLTHSTQHRSEAALLLTA